MGLGEEGRSKKQILLNNFLAGIAWTFGATVGLGIIVTILTLALAKINFHLVPVFGNFLAQIIDFAINQIGRKAL